jgi:hypothetical protein
VLIVGFPFFLAFIGIARVISLGEGRLLEAVTGERMPRRPVHPGAPTGVWPRIIEMLKDPRTWTTLAYLLLMLPLGIIYFTVAVVGIALAGALVVAPLATLADRLGWLPIEENTIQMHPAWLASPLGAVFTIALGVVILTVVMHGARGLGRAQVALARGLLVRPGA